MKLISALIPRSAMYAAWLLLAGSLVPMLTLLPVGSTAHAQQPGMAPEEIFKAGYDLYKAGRYKEAIPYLEKFEKEQKLHPNNDPAILLLGISYAQLGDWEKAIAMLEKLKNVNKTVEKKPLHEQSLFYLGFANYYFAMSKDLAITSEPKEKDPKFAKRKATLEKSLFWYNELFKTYPETGFKEDALYYSSLVKTQLDDYPGAQKDLETLIAAFPKSVGLPDYQYTLGQIFQTITAKLAIELKPKLAKDEAARKKLEEAVTKTLNQYTKVAENKEALSTANEAQLSRADMLFTLATMKEDPDASSADSKKDYVDALKEYRKVRRKEDVIVALARQKEALLKEIQAVAENPKAADLIRPRYQRVSSRLEEVKQSPDPRITAMIRMARIYNELNQYGEARVLIRRLISSGSVDAANKKEIESLLILSYALDGDDAKANEALDQFFAAYGNKDKASEGVSYFIAGALRRKDPPRLEDAVKNYERSIKDFPNGAYAGEAQMRKATALVSLKKFDEATGDLQAFITKNPNSPAVSEARYSLAEIFRDQGKFDDAIKTYLLVKADPKSGPFKAYATWWAGICYLNVGKAPEAIKELNEYLPLAKEEDMPGAMSKLADAYLANKQPDEAMKTLTAIAVKYPKEIYAPLALERIAAIYEADKKGPETAKAYDEVILRYPKSGSALRANTKMAVANSKAKNYDDAARYYTSIVKFDFTELEKLSSTAEKKTDLSDLATDAMWRIGDMYLRSKGTKMFTMLDPAEQEVWKKNMLKSQNAFIELLVAYPEKVTWMGRTSDGLADVLRVRATAKVIAPDEINKVLDAIPATVTDPKKSAAVRTRVDLTKALIAAEAKDPNALAMYDAVLKANPGLQLAPADVRRYGQALRDAGKTAEAEALYKKVKADFPEDAYADAEFNFGMGALALAKGDIPGARGYFTTLTTKHTWHPSIATMQPTYGLAQGAFLESEKETNPAKKAALQQEAYAGFDKVMQTRTAAQELVARSTYGLARVLEAQGKKTSNPSGYNAMDTYIKLYLFYPKMYPDFIPDALWRAGKMAHDAFPSEPDPKAQAALKAKARKCYEAIVKDYPTSDKLKAASDGLQVLGPPPAEPAKTK